MSGHADTIRDAINFGMGWARAEGAVPDDAERDEALAALDALVAEIQQQADRIAWLEGEVAGWRIKLAECEGRRGKP